MTPETFRACIDKLPKDTRIDFSGMCEPWLNKDCTDMVLYAHEKGFPITVYTTLVGMSIEDFGKIKDIPFEEFVVHVPDDQNSADIPITEEYLRLLRQVALYRRDDGYMLLTGVSCHAGLPREIEAELPKESKLIQEMQDRAGNLQSENVTHQHHAGEVVCINCGCDMNHNILLPDGTVLLCCMDYGMNHVLGNLLTQSYEDILHSKEADRVKKGLGDDGLGTLCRTCANAKSAEMIYQEYAVFRDWTRNLLMQQGDFLKDLDLYKNWTDNLQREKEELQKYTDSLQEQAEGLQEQVSEYKRYTARAKEGLHKITEDWNKKSTELQAVSSELEAIKNLRLYKRIEKQLRNQS